MRLAICGNLQLGMQIKSLLTNTDIDVTHFISDDTQTGGVLDGISLISFLQFEEMVQKKLIDGVIIAEDHASTFTKNAVKLFKLHAIPLVGTIGVVYRPVAYSPADLIYWLDPEKDYISYIETHIISSCNLNCKGCSHFAPLFSDKDFYNIESFKRDKWTIDSFSFQIAA